MTEKRRKLAEDYSREEALVEFQRKHPARPVPMQCAKCGGALFPDIDGDYACLGCGAIAYMAFPEGITAEKRHYNRVWMRPNYWRGFSIRSEEVHD